jgi:hypothetical protein
MKIVVVFEQKWIFILFHFPTVYIKYTLMFPYNQSTVFWEDFPSAKIMTQKRSLYVEQKAIQDQDDFYARTFSFLQALHTALYENDEVIIHRRLSFDNQEFFRIHNTMEKINGKDWVGVRNILISKGYKISVESVSEHNRFSLVIKR